MKDLTADDVIIAAMRTPAAAFTFDGHDIVCLNTDDYGFHSGRRRIRVECHTCKRVLHTGTTSAAAQIRMHLAGETGYSEEMPGYSEAMR